MTQNVRLQNLRDFTVQIRNDADQIVGTGIAVSMDGKVVTCAHVVEAALGAHPREVNGAEVGIYFPQVRGGEEKKRRAKVDCCFREHDDDMVLLQLIEGSSPLAPEQIAVLGMADQSEGNPFRTYGYSSIGNYPAARGDGIILGTVEPPLDRKLQADPVQLKSRDIASGMSGAAVLDVTRNLVVGLVAERFYPENAVQDDIGYGVDSKVLTFDPFDFVLRGEALELKPAPELRLDKDLFQQAIEIVNYVRAHRKPADKYSWNSAPTVLPEWTGRDDLLAQITADWNDPQKHVTGLIGFGGEGKSSLARKWVDDLCRGEAMLGAGRYLFVLDGLEVLQHQEGDQYGLLQSNDLRDLLTYFARPDNQSFCLITSRAPLLDLMEYTTYTHRDVDRLSEADGISLLEKLGVKGSKEQMGKVVSDWDGHALTISLLGSYLAEKYGGDIAHLADIPIPTADEPRYERVHRVLRRYDEHLTEAEREFLKLFSAFRTPVHESAFDKVFVPLLFPTTETTKGTEKKKGFFARFFNPSTDSPITNYQSPITAIVSRLVTYRILHCDTTSQTYTAHPLVRNHYLAILTHDTGAPDTHLKIKDYYLSIAGDTPQYPTLDDLKPLIEVVHHACQAGTYDEAWKIYWERIAQQTRSVVVHQLGAYETELTLMKEFFINGDIAQEPQGSNLQGNRGFIINEIGLCLMSLGRLREAVPFHVRTAKAVVEAQDWKNASTTYQNLADLYTQLGTLEQSAEAVRQALDLARKAEHKDKELLSLSYQGQVLSLQGRLKEAEETFEKAQTLEKEDDPTVQYLTRVAGVRYSRHLEKAGNLEYCRIITKANFDYCNKNHWFFIVSMCHRVLGDLDFDSSNPESARDHYESALKIARSISLRAVLIETLLARGRFLARVAVGAGSPRPNDARLGSGDPTPTINDAFTDLNEALNYAVEGGYRIYEADIRVELAWAYLANGEKEKAKQSAQRALQMSQEMGYHWGKVDAEEVMEKISNEM
ncbi:MAG: tetratricopeptide repeat protein [Chloroflexi bacterium]|nr:tetratricopeptide repeat protein [Chloroflexota bacterium]